VIAVVAAELRSHMPQINQANTPIFANFETGSSQPICMCALRATGGLSAAAFAAPWKAPAQRS